MPLFSLFVFFKSKAQIFGSTASRFYFEVEKDIQRDLSHSNNHFEQRLCLLGTMQCHVEVLKLLLSELAQEVRAT